MENRSGSSHSIDGFLGLRGSGGDNHATRPGLSHHAYTTILLQNRSHRLQDERKETMRSRYGGAQRGSIVSFFVG